MRGDTTAARGRATGRGEGAAGLSPTLVAWLAEESLGGRAVLDVGTGAGRLALHLAPRARRVMRHRHRCAAPSSRRSATRAWRGSATSLFVTADAEQADYRAFGQPDLVVAHLCMSDAIVARAGRACRPAGVSPSSRFHTDQWRETGRRVALRVRRDRRPRRPRARPASRRASRGGARGRARSRRRGRGAGGGDRAADALGSGRPLGGWERFLDEGGRTLTRAARRASAARRRDPGRRRPRRAESRTRAPSSASTGSRSVPPPRPSTARRSRAGSTPATPARWATSSGAATSGSIPAGAAGRAVGRGGRGELQRGEPDAAASPGRALRLGRGLPRRDASPGWLLARELIGAASGSLARAGRPSTPSAVLERDLAARAGLGWIGKNTMLLHPDARLLLLHRRRADDGGARARRAPAGPLRHLHALPRRVPHAAPSSARTCSTPGAASRT